MQDDAVSSMVSAVMVFAIIVAVMGVYTVDTVPDWIASREHAHAGDVAASFARMRADLDTQPADGSSASFTVDLAPDPVPLLQRAPSFGFMEVVSGTQGVDITIDLGAGAPSDQEQLLSVGGIVAAPGADPNAAAAPDWSKTAAIIALKLDAADGQSIRMTATENGASGRAVYVELLNPAASTVCQVNAAIPAASFLMSHEFHCSADASINGMGDLYGFKGLLAQMDADMSLAWTTSTSMGTAGIAFIDTDGTTKAYPTSGVTGQSLDQLIASDAVVFTPDYLEITDRTVRFDAGGVVNIQGDASAFIVEPVFTISVDSTTSPTQGFARWTIVDATGSGSLSGSSTAVFEFRKIATKDLILVVPAGASDSIFTVTSPASAAWEDMWTDALSLAGIEAPTAQVSVAGSSTSLRLDDGIPWTIHLTIHDVELSVT